MNTFTTLLDFISLAIQIVGSWIMYKNSPDNIPSGLIFAKVDTLQPQFKNMMVKRGFFLLGVGFVLTFLSMMLKSIF